MKIATSIYLYFLIGFYPLVFSSEGLADIFATKRFFFFAVTGIYLVSIFVLCIVYRKMPRINTAGLFAIIYLFISALSSLLSENLKDCLLGASRWEGLLTLFLYVALFICFSAFGSVSKGHAYTLIGSSTAFGTVCVIQLQGYNPFGLYPGSFTFFDGGVRYSGSYIGTIGNADFVGAYFCIIIPMLFYILFKSRIRFRFLAVIPLALLLYTVSKMSVTSCIVGLGVGAVFAIPDLLSFKRRTVFAYAFGIAALGIFAVSLLRTCDFGTGFLHEIHEVLNGRISPEFGSNRIRIWKDVISVFPEAPLIGKGPDTMIREGFEKFSTFYPALNKTLTTSIDVAHNEYLNVLYHQGILGLAAFLTTVFLSLKNVFFSRSALGSSLCISLIAYLAEAFFGISILLVSPFFWVTLALASQKPPTSEALYF